MIVEQRVHRVYIVARRIHALHINARQPARHFWQAGPGYDANLYELESMYKAIDYIHNNPVRRGLVAHAADWPWSSARDWAGLGCPYINVDRTLPRLHPDGQ